MAKILHYIFNNSNYSVYYGVDSDKKGIEVKLIFNSIKLKTLLYK
ncbi:MAG: hypothetical protein PVH61_28800 [Candidatus Aminicenantes bacterium]|jgi:hypothetical protein